MKRFFVLAALVLGLAACQTEPEGLDVNVGGEVDTTITVSLPETTRATDSALGAFENVDLIGTNYTVRYIFEVYYGNTGTQKQVYYTDGRNASFPVRLVPGRHYNFVAWADIVAQPADDKMNKALPYEDTDLHYDTAELKSIKLNGEWNAMDETRDAFTGHFDTAVDGDKKPYNGSKSINIPLTRPFAKLRVITTDMVELRNLGIEPHNAVATYTTAHYSTFNACDATYSGELTNVSHEYVIASYGETGANKTIFTDYFFANNEVVKFNLDVKEENGETIKANIFSTDIYVRRNHLTTIQGDILTDGNNVTVNVEDAFKNGSTWNPNEDKYDYETISSAAEFYAAANGDGGKYIAIANFTLSGISTTSYAATRSSTSTDGKVVEIDLNGMTITVDNNSSDALITLGDYDALIISGVGTIESIGTGTGKLVEGGNVVVTGAADVDEDVADVKSGLDALVYICKNGGEFTFVEDLTATEVVLVETTNPVVINGANHTLTSSATRAIRVTPSKANVTINDLNIVVATERVYPNDVRGISLDAGLNGVDLTLNNCSVDFTHKTANDWAYAVNVSGNGTDNKVTVNGGTYNGANVVNAHSAKNTIVVKNATLTSLYPNNDTYYGACIWVLQNQGSTVYAEGNTFNGSNAIAFNLGTGTVLEEKNNTDNTKYVAAKVGGVYYYNIAEAIAAAEDGATVEVLQSHDCNVGATVAAGKTITLDLNGKTITGTDTATVSYAIITNKGNLTITGNGKMTLKAENNREWNAYSSVISNTVGGKLVVENGTIEHLGGTDMAYGIDNLTNGKGTYAETVINGGTIKSTYRAVRMFLNGIEAQNLLTVNGGIIEGDNKSIWMQDPSKNANTGKLVVTADAVLKGDAYLSVTAGSTEWPVEVSIANDAFEGESTLLYNNNVPTGYEVIKKGGIWTVIGYTEVSTADELIAALKAGKDVRFLNDITVAATDGGYSKAGIIQNKAQTIDGNDYTLTVTGAGATWDCAIYTNGGTIKNLTVAGAMRGIFTAGQSSDLNIENVTFKNVIYTFNSDGNMPANPFGVYVSDSNVNGWTSHSNMHTEVVYTNCSFGEGSGYKYCRPYGKTSFVNCTFCAGYTIDESKTKEITYTDCTWQE